MLMVSSYCYQNVTWFGETLHMGFFRKLSLMHGLVDKLYHRSIDPSLRPIACFVVEIQRFVCDRASPPIIDN